MPALHVVFWGGSEQGSPNKVCEVTVEVQRQHGLRVCALFISAQMLLLLGTLLLALVVCAWP